MARRIVSAPPPYTLGVESDQEVEYPTPESTPSGALSQRTMQRLVRKYQPAAQLTPVFFLGREDSGLSGGPQLSYVAVSNSQWGFTIEGFNFPEFVSIDVTTDVSVGGNAGSAPPVVSVDFDGPDDDFGPFGPPGEININVLLGSGGSSGDVWGITLTDVDGNEFAVPTPIYVFPSQV